MASKTFRTFGVLGLYTETPLHCGAEGGTGYVDLPIQRERHTQYPVIPGSTIKGVLRDELKREDGEQDEKKLTAKQIGRLFGEEEEREDGKTKKPGAPGTVSFGDGLLVAFPIRSSGAPFHWVTCPFVLERVFRLLGASVKLDSIERGKALGKAGKGDVLLEEIRVTLKPETGFFDSGLPHLLSLFPSGEGFEYTREIFPNRLLVLSDEDFRELVETGTEVLTRIKLNVFGTTTTKKEEELPVEERGKYTAQELQGNMFVEEVVPPETLFIVPLRAGGAPEDLVAALEARKVIRLGGDETIGRGVTHMTFVEGKG